MAWPEDYNLPTTGYDDATKAGAPDNPGFHVGLHKDANAAIRALDGRVLSVEGGGPVVAIPYAASITPNADTTRVAVVGTLTGNITINNPSGAPADGRTLRFRFVQDATGGRTITWGTQFAFGTDVTAALIPATASAKWEMMFSWDAATSKWRALSIARGF